MIATGRRILIVDDEIDLINMLSTDLVEQGYIVDSALDGIEGLRKIDENRPDLVISDLKMPRMNGLEFLIAMQERGMNIPVVILTAYGDYKSIRTAWKHGAFDFIEKPVDHKTLSELIQIALVLGTSQAKVDEKQRFGQNSYRKVELKLDEKEYEMLMSIAEEQGLSISSLYLKLVEDKLGKAVNLAS